MARIIIPTRNRPTSLAGVLTYLHTYYPRAEVIVADGSKDSYKQMNRAMAAELAGKPAVDYRAYDYDTPFFDRLLDVLKSENDPYFIMGSDDDFPMMDVFDRAQTFLLANPDYSTALGATIHLTLSSPTDMTARLGVARPIIADVADRRALAFARWMFSTTYAITRRELLVERYERARKNFLVRFYDYAVGVHDSMAGKIKCIPSLGFVGTRNYGHSYLRPESGLVYLRRADQVLQHFDTMAADLRSHTDFSAEEIDRLATRLISTRISVLCGNLDHRRPNFKDSREFTNPLVQRQFELFDQIFLPDNEIRTRYEAKLKFISAAVRRNSTSEDNKGERRYYETLENQAADKSDSSVHEDQDQLPMFSTRPRVRPPSDQLDKVELNVALDPETMLLLPSDSVVS